MHWNIDRQTWDAATKYPVSIKHSEPVGPFVGRSFNTPSWNRRVVQPANWQGTLRSDPDQIIQQFRSQRYTQALALVVSWGTMWRQPSAIWGGRNLETIEAVLCDCAQSIRKSESIAVSWNMLRVKLDWTSVLISKTLHFLCLSLGFDRDPPVPIDGAVIRERVWPVFRDSIPVSERPRNWDGDSLEAYGRYMTAILAWADLRHWSTPDVERTICAEVKPEWMDGTELATSTFEKEEIVKTLPSPVAAAFATVSEEPPSTYQSRNPKWIYFLKPGHNPDELIRDAAWDKFRFDEFEPYVERTGKITSDAVYYRLRKEYL